MISIIIPVYNEADVISKNISNTRKACATDLVEIIVVDGGSSDETVAVAQRAGVILVKSEKGRAKQMNHGATVAKGEILYFLHADSIPPLQFDLSIWNAYQKGAQSGCFRLAFDYEHWFLKANSWFTRFDVNAFRFGDQSLFVSKKVFHKSGGFRTDLMIMEDQEIIHRIKQCGKFVVINDYVTTSARKYLVNGIYSMQGIFFRIWALYYLGYSQGKLLKLYKKLIRKHKL
ncbi:rSAM/selenodomain-associated transferase 2 [Pedobacter sp. CG_S7]|uniref:TIGR04283 family arsenosugar biosynthesis glycosyltransferase n=1 Tax=Pedobacter sp. CG_S7 TaxID=3143930 RepID=UPI003397B386